MRLFILTHKECSNNGYLQGARKHYVPPVICPNCGIRAYHHGQLPGVDLGKIDFKLPSKPIRPEEFLELKSKLQPLYPSGFTVQKCQGLGGVTVQARGKMGDLIGLPGSGLFFFKTECAEKLNQSGIVPIQFFPIRFERKSKLEGQIVEGQIHGQVSFGNSVYPNGRFFECQICGGHNIVRLDDDKVCIKKSSIPSNGDFFAVKQWGDICIVTERFKLAAEKVLTDAGFLQVPIVDE